MADAVGVERVREKLAQLRTEADTAAARAEAAEVEVERLERLLLEKENAVKSLEARLGTSEAELEKTESGLREARESVRALDLKAEQAERQAAVAQKERDGWEARCEAAEARYRVVEAEIAELVDGIEGL
ncbi:actin filament-coating protein tropomyosin [Mycena filopes]|nr:actin filament-coating protein tropomyosin [Mycena filopes]